MLGGKMTTRCNVLKTAVVARGNFGAIVQTSRIARMASTTDNSSEKENLGANGNQKQSYDKRNTNFISGSVLKENINVTNEHAKTHTSKVASKKEIIRQMLDIERHHVIEVIQDEQGNLCDVRWCPVYLRPDAQGRARGGDEIPHHRCKTCTKIGFHLLNDGQKYRPCLRCAGWREEEIPAWYYHVTCCHCEQVL